MDITGQSQEQLVEILIKLAGSLTEEDLMDPATFGLANQLVQMLDPKANPLPQELVDQLKNIHDKATRFKMAAQAIGANRPDLMDKLVDSLKAAGLWKSDGQRPLPSFQRMDRRRQKVQFAHHDAQADAAHGDPELKKAMANPPATPAAPHNDHIRSVADSYAGSKGFKLQHDLPKVKVNPEFASRVATAYQGMEHSPAHPETKAAYDALIDETTQQLHHLQRNGYKFSAIKPGQANPYASGSAALNADLRDNKHAHYYPTEQGFGSTDSMHPDHPMLRTVKDIHGNEMPANDAFRIVHDVFGHAKEGHSFGPNGEEAAYRHHSQMFSPLARRALTAETRGQNSWVNFGPHAAHNRANPEKTVFADQKAGLLPSWAEEHYSDEMKKSELEKGVNGNWQDEGYTFRASHSKKAGHTIRAYKGKTRVGHLAFLPDADKNGYHSVYNAHISEDHRGKGLYQEMIRQGIKHAQSLGAKGLKTDGYQRSGDATRAWQKINPEVKEDNPNMIGGKKFTFYADERHLSKAESNDHYLEHYSAKETKFDTIDPNFHGTGISGDERKRHGRPNRTYYYDKGTANEPMVTGRAKFKYIVKAPSKILDLASKEAEPHKEASKTSAGIVDHTELEHRIKNAGYDGYRHSGSALPNVVALFHAQKPVETHDLNNTPSNQKHLNKSSGSEPLNKTKLKPGTILGGHGGSTSYNLSHNLVFPVSIGGHAEDPYDKTLPAYHMKVTRLSGSPLGMYPPVSEEGIQRLVDKHELHPPKGFSVRPHSVMDKKGNTHHYLLIDNVGKNVHEASSAFKDEHESKQFTPAIKVSKRIHDKVKYLGHTAESLGIKFHPAEHWGLPATDEHIKANEIDPKAIVPIKRKHLSDHAYTPTPPEFRGLDESDFDWWPHEPEDGNSITGPAKNITSRMNTQGGTSVSSSNNTKASDTEELKGLNQDFHEDSAFSKLKSGITQAKNWLTRKSEYDDNLFKSDTSEHFAVALHRKFGYPIRAIMNKDKVVGHFYSHDPRTGHAVDVSGRRHEGELPKTFNNLKEADHYHIGDEKQLHSLMGRKADEAKIKAAMDRIDLAPEKYAPASFKSEKIEFLTKSIDKIVDMATQGDNAMNDKINDALKKAQDLIDQLIKSGKEDEALILAETLEKGKNRREQQAKVFGGWKTSPDSPRRAKQMAALEEQGKRRYGLETERSPGKPNAEGKIIDKPSFDNPGNKIQHIGNPDSLVHEHAHLEVEKQGSGLKNLQDDMDSEWGRQNKKYGYKQQARVKDEYSTTALENPLRRRAGLPAHQKETKEKNPKRDYAADVPGKKITQEIPGGKKLTGTSSNRTPEHNRRMDQVDRGELKFHPDHGWQPGTGVNSKINQRARAIAENPANAGRKDAKTLMRGEDGSKPLSFNDMKKADLAKSWEIKVKGQEGYHPVRDVVDQGHNKQNAYILHDGTKVDHERVEDLRIGAKNAKDTPRATGPTPLKPKQ